MELVLIYETDKPKRKKVKSIKAFAKTIYEAWNYEESVFVDGNSITFCPHESIENNDEWLSEYGLGIKEIEGVQKLYDRSSGKIFENPYY